MDEQRKFDVMRAEGASPEADAQQVSSGNRVRDSLANAFKEVVENVPACPTRTRALNMLIDCRMLANAAITFKGRY